MKRKIIYGLAGIVMFTILFGFRFYQGKQKGTQGYLSSEAVYFSGVPSDKEAGKEMSVSGAASVPGKADGSGAASVPGEANGSGAASVPGEADGSGAASVPGEADGSGAASVPGEADGSGAASVPGEADGSGAAQPKASYPRIVSNAKVTNYNDTGVSLIGDTAYELYNYVDSAAKSYAEAVNRLAKNVGKNVVVYDMVAPTSAGITLPDNKIKKINTSSQKAALKQISKKISKKAVFIPLYDKLMQHRKEYIYFRTDHHWTAKGAYYAYQAFLEAKGMSPNPISGYRKRVAKDFLGTFYNETNQNNSLRKDKFIYYLPLCRKLSMTYRTADGARISAPVIADASAYGESTKYSAFIAGDNPYTVVKNRELQDGSSCLVVKESFGNAFVPYLADHYQTIYVVDYRYWEGKISDIIKEKKVREVILMNNISMTRNSYLIGKLSQIIP